MTNLIEKDKTCPLSFFGHWARFFIKKYRVTTLILLLIIIGGVFGLFQIPREGFPDVNIPVGAISTVYPGATSSDVEKQVTNKIEEAVAGLDNLDEYQSTSAPSFSTVVVFFDVKTDFDQNLQRLRDAVNKAQSELPEDAEEPEINTAGAFVPDLIFNIAGPYNARELKEYAMHLEEELKNIDNTYEFQIVGGADREIKIRLNLEELNDRGLTVSQIQQAVAGSNINLPGGTIENGEGELTIQTRGQYENPDELEETVVGATAHGALIKLDDVADIEDTFEKTELVNLAGSFDDDTAEFKVNPSVLMFADINKGNGKVGDVIREADKIKNYLDNEINRELIPENVKVSIVLDSADIVSDQLDELTSTAWQGLIVIVIVLFIFISLRSSLIIGFIIPTVFLATVFVFNLLGFTFNVLTLFSLILVLGMLVDNAIVIVEGVQYNLLRGMSRFRAACRAVSDLGPAVLAATLTTVVVFIPIALMTGITGEFIKFIPYTVITAIVASLVVALTITPLLAAKFMKVGRREKKQMGEGGEIKHWRVVNGWANGIKKALDKKWKIITAILVAFALLFGSFSLVGSGQVEVDMWPAPEDADSFNIEATFDKGTPTREKEAVIQAMGQKIGELPEVTEFTPLFYEASDTLQFQINLTKMDDREITSSEVIDQLREKIKEIPDSEIQVAATGYGPPQATYPVEVQFTGDDLDDLKAAAVDLGAWLADQEGIKNVRDGVNDATVSQVEIDLNREEIKDQGLNIFLVASQIRGVYQDEEISKFVDPATDESFAIKLGFRNEDRDSIDDIEELVVGAGRGGEIKLADVADIQKTSVLNNIDHYEGERYVEVRAAFNPDISSDQVKKDIEGYLSDEKLGEFNLDRDSLTFRGDFQMEEESFDNFYNALYIAIILVYIILVLQFNSFAQPFAILLTVVLALTGVFFGLWVTGNPVSFIAMIGIIALIGIAVNDSIVLVDQINRFRKDEMGLKDAIAEGIKVRFKPILSTTVTTIGGILPLTLAVEFWEGLGSALIFGLIASTIFTLSVIPIIYYTFTARGERKRLARENS